MLKITEHTYLSFLLFSLCVMVGNKTGIAQKNNNPEAHISEAYQLKSKAEKLYNQNPDSSLICFKLARGRFQQLNFEEDVADCEMNIAFIFYEKWNNSDSAVYYASKSANGYENLGLALKQANVLKYIGMLYGQQGNIIVAKNLIIKAIKLFELQNYTEGTAVCYFNLASSFEVIKQADSCLYYINRANRIWTDHNQVERIIQNTIFILEKFASDSSLQTTLSKTFYEGEKYMNQHGISTFTKQQFYQAAIHYLSSAYCLADRRKLDKYKTLIKE